MRITTPKLMKALMSPSYVINKAPEKMPSVVPTNLFAEPIKIRNRHSDFIDELVKKFMKK